MPSLAKILSKFDAKERKILELLIADIIFLDWKNLDIKKLKGHKDIFRVRKGKMRIIFSQNSKDVNIIAIERRSDNTYDL